MWVRNLGAAWLGSTGRKFLRKKQIFAGVAVLWRLEEGRKLAITSEGLTGRAGGFVLAVGRHLSFSPHGLLPSLLGCPHDRRSKSRNSHGAAMLFMTYP